MLMPTCSLRGMDSIPVRSKSTLYGIKPFFATGNQVQHPGSDHSSCHLRYNVGTEVCSRERLPAQAPMDTAGLR